MPSAGLEGVEHDTVIFFESLCHAPPLSDPNALGVPLKLGQPPSSYVITGGVPHPPWLWVRDPPPSFLP